MPTADPTAEPHEMTIAEHLRELRGRLIKCLLAVAVGTLVAFLFTGTIFDLLKSRAEGIQLVRTQMTEMVGAYFKVAMISGMVLATPVLLYQGVMFVVPALTPKEKRYLYLLMPGVLVSFFIGVLFAFFVLLPPALNFLLSFGADIAEPLIKVGDYVSLVAGMLFWIGLSFETPLIMSFLARIHVVRPSFLARHRRYAIVGAFVLGAVITPTVDPLNQALVSVPLMLLYELGIWLGRLAWKEG